jgi:hypothetical protein
VEEAIVPQAILFERIGKTNGIFAPPLSPPRRRPLLARSAGGSPSTPRRPAAAARG